MWPASYWPVVYWSDVYWPKVGAAVVPIPELCFPLTVVTHNPIRTVVTGYQVDVHTRGPIRTVVTHNPERTVETVCN